MTAPLVALPGLAESARRYRTIVCDPPWSYKNKWHLPRGTDNYYTGSKLRRMKGRGASANYACMTLDDIAALPVSEWADVDAHLYLWATNAFVADGSASAMAKAWGFLPVTVLTWVKTQIGMGVYFRNTTEQVLFCTRGSLKTLRKDQPTHFVAARAAHSEKPAAFYDIVESMSPGPYLDVFARKLRFNWDAWGMEVGAPEGLPHPEGGLVRQ